MRLRILHIPVVWLGLLLAGSSLWCPGCETAEPPAPAVITYTYDSHTQELISELAGGSQANPYKDFDRRFSGLYVPASLFAMEPFVLGLSTESRIPAMLLVEAHWVKRYGRAGWLHGLEPSQVNLSKDDLVPQLAEAFVMGPAENKDRRGKALMAMPTSLKGNILFFRKDLLTRYGFKPPRNWDELKAICSKILPREKGLKYGLVLHPIGFVNDFFPIFWGFGGRVMEDDIFVLGEPQNQEAFLAALKEILGLRGTILPWARDMKNFEDEGTVGQSFFQGEALFMINWNTSRKDLSEGKGRAAGSLITSDQVGVAPIPSRAGHDRRYSNLASLGWAVNNFAANAWNGLQVMEGVRQFLHLVVNDQFQLLAAEKRGEVPSLRGALEKLKNPEVLQVYHEVFAAQDVEIKMRPFSRMVNNTLEKHLRAALYGQETPEAALQGVLQEIK